MMTIEYPMSRANVLNCKVCKGVNGLYQKGDILTLQGANGGEVKFLQFSCAYCGHTVLFDLNAVKRSPYRGEGEEVVPDFGA